jgi:hypothetical protein
LKRNERRSGYAVVTRSSADCRLVEGKIVKQRKKVSTRGLNRNHNPQLKQVFRSAALTASRRTAIKAWRQILPIPRGWLSEKILAAGSGEEFSLDILVHRTAFK